MQPTFTQIITMVGKLLFKSRPTEALIEALTLTDLHTLSNYNGTLPYHDMRVRALVWELKYYAGSKAVNLVGEYFAPLLLEEAADCIGKPLLLPMPMHKKRRHERGHNQTEVLCLAALPLLSNALEYNPHILMRTRHTKPQQGLERHVRLKNLEAAMQVTCPELVKDRICIVVDDVTTTGASFAEAKRALKLAGAAEVRTMALAQS